jgi:hypothetical protein
MGVLYMSYEVIASDRRDLICINKREHTKNISDKTSFPKENVVKS